MLRVIVALDAASEVIFAGDSTPTTQAFRLLSKVTRAYLKLRLQPSSRAFTTTDENLPGLFSRPYQKR
jgi:hypothetical protein